MKIDNVYILDSYEQEQTRLERRREAIERLEEENRKESNGIYSGEIF